MSWKKELRKEFPQFVDGFQDDEESQKLESFVEKTIKQEKIKILNQIESVHDSMFEDFYEWWENFYNKERKNLKQK